MLSFRVFAILQLRRPASLVPADTRPLHSRHHRGAHEKQLLLTSSKTRPYTPPANCDARIYESCRVSPTALTTFLKKNFNFLRFGKAGKAPKWFVRPPFFSTTYKLQISQALYFDIHGSDGGCRGAVPSWRRFNVRTFRPLSDLSLFFSDSYVLFCTQQKLNSFIIKRFRTLGAKHGE
jgi:hypothetical protein